MSKSQVKFKVILQRVQGHSVRLSQVLRIHIQWLYFPVALSMCFSCMWMVNLARHNFLLPKCASFWRQSVWQMTTSSSAVAKRPHYALCLSVVSFSSTIPQAQFFYYFGFGFISAYSSILFCCLWHNVEPCCHTHDSQMTVTVYSARPRLVGLALYTVTDNHDCLQRISTWHLVVRYPQSTKTWPVSAIN